MYSDLYVKRCSYCGGTGLSPHVWDVDCPECFGEGFRDLMQEARAEAAEMRWEMDNDK